MTVNALTFDENILSASGSAPCGKIFYAGGGRLSDERVVHFVTAGSGADYERGDGVYLPSVMDDAAADEAIERAAEGRRMIISACVTLDEVGTCDKKYGATPVGLAHKFGLLGELTYISGGVYLDKDDIDLIVQSGAKVILTPSDSLGFGCGIPPLRMLETLGARVLLGTGSGRFNAEADLGFERRLMLLAASGMLCTPDPVSADFLARMTEE